MSEFQGQIEWMSAISAAWAWLPATGRLAATARRGMPRMMWMPKRRPRAWMRSASGLKPRPPAEEGNRFAAGVRGPVGALAGAGAGREAGAESVDAVGERLEAEAAGGRGEPICGGDEAAVRVHGERGVGTVAVSLGVGIGPLDVDDHVLPAVGFEILGHVGGVGQDFLFGHGGAVAVPTIPAHGRRGGGLGGRGR